MTITRALNASGSSGGCGGEISASAGADELGGTKAGGAFDRGGSLTANGSGEGSGEDAFGCDGGEITLSRRGPASVSGASPPNGGVPDGDGGAVDDRQQRSPRRPDHGARRRPDVSADVELPAGRRVTAATSISRRTGPLPQRRAMQMQGRERRRRIQRARRPRRASAARGECQRHRQRRERRRHRAVAGAASPSARSRSRPRSTRRRAAAGADPRPHARSMQREHRRRPHDRRVDHGNGRRRLGRSRRAVRARRRRGREVPRDAERHIRVTRPPPSRPRSRA